MTRRDLMVCGALALGILSCGPPSQAGAVSAAAQHGCNYYQRCNLIGSSSSDPYATYSSCDADLSGKWNAAWPASACDGHISSTGLNACLVAIDNTACNNAADFLNTVFNKCNEQSVCAG